MKKSLLTLGAVLGISTGALAQGTLAFTAAAGINTVTSNGGASSGWYTGNVTVAIYTIAASGNSALATTINTDGQTLGSQGAIAAVNLIETDFTLQDISPIGNAAGAEAASQTDAVSGGAFVSEGNTQIGTASSLPQTTDIYYAIVLTTASGLEGGLVLDSPAAGYLPSTSPVNSMTSEYPANGENILLSPVPEPTTLALAGLGGLSMLFLRRRKA